MLQRQSDGTLRQLSQKIYPTDFCSNDYLGFARSSELAEMIKETAAGLPLNGAAGSRLLSGNAAFTEATEKLIASYHGASAGLIFNSGYDANIGLLSSLAKRGDTIITDELIHASLIDGARLSHADRFKFKHNDLEDLEHKLRAAKGNIFVIVESIYSMDGDLAPLCDIVKICKVHQANLIVDEAHAVGIFGEKGEGLVHALQLTEDVFARVVTFGKAMGSHGAILLGNNTLRDYLINFSRSFIYTTAAPPHTIAAIYCAYQLLERTDLTIIRSNIAYYNQLAAEHSLETNFHESAIKTLFLKSIEATRNAAAILQEKGMDVRPIVSPTVAPGTERLRITLHAYNTKQEIEQLVQTLINLKTS